MSSNEDTLWKAVYLIMGFVATLIGNGLVIVVVYRSRRNQWTTNHFVISLAIVNLVAPSLYFFLNLHSTIRHQWLFGNIGCKMNAFLVHFNAFASVGILCCISFDRYYLTAHPLTFKLSKKQTKKVILVVWTMATIITCPMPFFYQEQSASCVPDFSVNWTAYFSCFGMLFLFSHIVTYATYFKVARCIQARNNHLNGARFVQKVPRTKIKVTKLLVFQVMVHTALWFPYITYQVIISTSTDSDQTLLLILTYFAYASSAASPLIYGIFSPDFRRGCKLIFIKYDASVPYRLPAQLGRKNKVDVMSSETGNFHLLTALGKQERSVVFERDSGHESAEGHTDTFELR